MILVGRDLSPYARRLAIWCALQGREVERKHLAAANPDHAAEILTYHPGLRVPALKLDDGTVLIDTWAIMDYLDETGERRLVPAAGTARRACLQRIAIATATAEKLTQLIGEHHRRPEPFRWEPMLFRVRGQLDGGFAAMEAAAPRDGWHGGAAPDGSDVATVVIYQMAEVMTPELVAGRYPRLAALAERAMALEPFRTTYPQPG